MPFLTSIKAEQKVVSVTHLNRSLSGRVHFTRKYEGEKVAVRPIENTSPYCIVVDGWEGGTERVGFRLNAKTFFRHH